jgi:flagellin-like hook-associated protein FlgL
MRIGTFTAFNRVLLGIHANQFAGLRAQEQISSGRRILRPSDDPAGTARALALRRDLARSVRIQDSIAAGRSRLEQATTTLQNSSGLLTRARELVLQAMSGALNDGDRAALAAELEEIREQLLDDANLRMDESYAFSGTAFGTQPWVEVVSGGRTHAQYRGNGHEQSIQIGADAELAISAAGNRIYARAVPGAVRFDGLTGVRSGTTADEGTGSAYLVLRHDGTDTGLLGSVGAALIDGDERNTLLGPNTLRIDGAAGTVQLGNGQAVKIPPPGQRADVAVRNEQGGVLHLDLEGWNGNDYTGTVTGRGSVSLDGVDFTALTFTETDLELADPILGQVLHLDTTGVRRAGVELVSFGDTDNAFDLLAGVVEDLANGQELDSAELNARLGNRLETLDRVHDDLLLGLGVLGARSARLNSATERQGDLALQLTGRLSEVEDADLSEAALEFTRSQAILELAQAAGARLIQTSLLQFLG